jgi:hypothetical protein
MRLDLSYKNFKVMFGQFDTDVIFEYTACMSFALAKPSDGVKDSVLLYDEVKMIVSADITSADDIAFIHFLNFKHDVDERFGSRKMPIRNNMDMTEQDYKEFLTSYGFFLNDFKKFLNNDYLAYGIRFPYNPEEFYTTVNFKEQSMHIMLEVEEEAYEWFDE